MDILKDYKPIEEIEYIPDLFRPIAPLIDIPMMVVDIETSGLEPKADRIYAIGIKTRNGSYIFEDRDETVLVKRFVDAFFKLKDQAGRFILVGHNIFKFDVPFIIHRGKMLGVIPDNLKTCYGVADGYDTWFPHFVKLSNGQKLTRHLRTAIPVFYPDNSFAELRCANCDIIDTMILAGLQDGQFLFKSKGLKNLAIELGCRQERRLELSVEEIRASWEANDGKLREYLGYDLEDTFDIFYKLMPPFYYMRSFLNMSLQELVISSTAKKIETMIENHYPGRKVKADEKVNFQGALTGARKGLYFNVYKADVASQYPFAMLGYRLGPGSTKDPDSWFLRILKTLRDKRLELKRSSSPEDKAVSNAMKIIINSGYGMLGSGPHDYNNMESARKVTEYGRLIVTKMMEVIGNDRIVELDTDGIMFSSEDPDIFQKLHAQMPAGLEIEQEFKADWVYIHGAKNYIIKLGDRYIKRGIFRKRDTVPLKHDFVMNFLETYIKDPLSANKFYAGLSGMILTGKMGHDKIIRHRRIGKAEKAVLKFGKPGDDIDDYYGYDEKGKKTKVIEGPYHKEFYAKELSKWYDELIANLTQKHELEIGGED